MNDAMAIVARNDLERNAAQTLTIELRASVEVGALPITALPVASVAATNAHLYMWTTNAFIEPAHAIRDHN